MTERDKVIDPTEKVAIVAESGYVQMVSVKGLADKGYRKEEEVRKETVIEYSNKIDEIFNGCISNKIGDDFDYEYFSNCLRNLKKQFGVETEE